MHRDHAHLESPCPDEAEAAGGANAKEKEQEEAKHQEQQEQHHEHPIRSRADLDALLSRGDGACVVLFTSDGCSPCKRIEPSYAALRRRLDGSGVTFARAVVGGDGDGGGDTSAARSPSPSPGADASSVDALAAELDVSTLPTWVCLKGGGAGEVARVAGARHKRPLQPVAAAVRWRLLLQPPSEADGDDERPPT